MGFPSTWAAVLLDASLDPAPLPQLATTLAKLGTSATITTEGWLALPGDLLARPVAAPYPSDLLSHPGATDVPTRASASYLEISGGGLDVDRPILEHRTEAGSAITKSGRFLKLERTASSLALLSSLGEGVVLPVTAHRFVPWTAWPTSGAGEIFATLVTLARSQRELSTRGLRLFGVPEIGAAIAGDAAACSRTVLDAAFEAAWQGFVPVTSQKLTAHVDRDAGSWTLARVAIEGLWITDRGGDARSFALRTGVAKLVGSHLFDDPAGSPDETPVALFGNAERRLACTLDLHRIDRAKGPIELVAFSPRSSRHAAFALRQVAAVVRASPDALDAYHRVAIPALEPVGIAGVVLWPSGHLPMGADRVSLLEAFPVTTAELARFRAGEQGAWMDGVERQNAFASLQARWCGPGRDAAA
jgi:hypothetical protein